MPKSAMKRIYVVGTADTKADELRYLLAEIRALGFPAVGVDVGTLSTGQLDVAPAEVARYAGVEAEAILAGQDRGRAVSAMASAFAIYLASRTDIAGVIGIGGGGGTSIVAAGMRGLPLGIPKLMVSTLASGDVSPYVDVSDIMMMPSITDMAGLNRISRVLLRNAAGAIVGMASAPPLAEADSRPAVGLTMFGVTTPCVTMIADALRAEYDCLVFHATGVGGRAMEKLVESGMLEGVLDITTTEVCDLLVGGVLAAWPERLDAIAQTRLPYIGSAGALDMVNFWAPDTVPNQFKDRLLYQHNDNVTLMRANAEESRQIGAWIGLKLNACEGPVRFLLPEKGVSALDIDGGQFFDEDADTALFDALESTVRQTSDRQILRLPYHINDPEFAAEAVAAFREIAS